MRHYEEEDITNVQYQDYKYKEEGINRHNERKTSVSINENEKTRRRIGYYLDLIITLGFLVIGIFGAIFIIKYGMPVGEDSFNVLGLKSVTEMTSNTVNNITEMTSDSIKQTFNIQSKSIVGQPKYSIFISKDSEYSFSCPRVLSRNKKRNSDQNSTPQDDEKFSKEYEEYIKKYCKNNESENNTKKDYTPVQFIKENSLSVAGSGLVTITASLHTALVSM
ncbi:hypothetical protein H8356DRAFT_981834 [Neocallimastix lanati (nom. inval.)]|uniref:Uncharacterized protein n=1 Tax=Neocallimastix californiae TaxID=1754190 RepID=A0A1Y2B614_9FUNG|nr:hypothetical protein H8356DRAFT_981834 [Neocallimastix sp. JGI-2020a]ORY30282.1 hypothetical protein LY90DRAFT_512702 [Neocallimastix californiae]|eukprot:ORY30282.1 hypothetical protein LY90DRAFT_512702 [Neocallimastix californiae]